MSHGQDQLARLRPLLEEAHRSQTKFLFGFGAAVLLLGLSCPASKVLGSLAEGAVSSPFVHRMANFPIWVIAIMVVCGVGLGALSLLMGIKARAGGSPVVAHLKAHPEDALVSVQTRIVINRGYRSAHYHFVTASGRQVTEILGYGFEPRMEELLASMPIARD
ncbi:MAG TPA: hypothetical protein RMH99_28960 [Sandaracinaceae bacterium LLY-WYZ-13_1]|nr:hypothetical protein [Sandaracinaceae bacterium LLY-WYZ-13_1]